MKAISLSLGITAQWSRLQAWDLQPNIWANLLEESQSLVEKGKEKGQLGEATQHHMLM
jgi:hypothetical protein